MVRVTFETMTIYKRFNDQSSIGNKGIYYYIPNNIALDNLRFDSIINDKYVYELGYTINTQPMFLNKKLTNVFVGLNPNTSFTSITKFIVDGEEYNIHYGSLDKNHWIEVSDPRLAYLKVCDNGTATFTKEN